MGLPQAELDDSKNFLSKWHDPLEVLKFTGELIHKDGPEFSGQNLFRKERKFLREAHCCAYFTEITRISNVKSHYNKVRLWKDPPDFQIQTAQEETENWEIVELLDPNRKRNDEFKHPKNELELDFSSESKARKTRNENFTQLIEHLNCTASKKAAKNYPSHTRLLCYLNLYLGYSRPSGFPELLLKGMEPAKLAFREIWVLENPPVYPQWSSANPEIDNPVTYPLWCFGKLHPDFKSPVKGNKELNNLWYR